MEKCDIWKKLSRLRIAFCLMVCVKALRVCLETHSLNVINAYGCVLHDFLKTFLFPLCCSSNLNLRRSTWESIYLNRELFPPCLPLQTSINFSEASKNPPAISGERNHWSVPELKDFLEDFFLFHSLPHQPVTRTSYHPVKFVSHRHQYPKKLKNAIPLNKIKKNRAKISTTQQQISTEFSRLCMMSMRPKKKTKQREEKIRKFFCTNFYTFLHNTLKRREIRKPCQC